MTIKIRNGKAIEVLETLRVLLTESVPPDKRMPVKAAYWFNRFEVLLDDIVIATQKAQRALVNQYAERDDKGKMIQLPNNRVQIQADNIEDFEDALRSLMTQENELPFVLREEALGGMAIPATLGALIELEVNQ